MVRDTVRNLSTVGRKLQLETFLFNYSWSLADVNGGVFVTFPYSRREVMLGNCSPEYWRSILV